MDLIMLAKDRAPIIIMHYYLTLFSLYSNGSAIIVANSRVQKEKGNESDDNV